MTTRRILRAAGLGLLITATAAAGPPRPGSEPGTPLVATKVRVDPAGKSVVAVARGLGDTMGMPIAMAPDLPWDPGHNAKAGDRAAPPGVAGEMTFWEALDRLGREARMEIAPRRTQAGPVIELESPARPPAPSKVEGAYRVSLMALVEDRTIVYGDPLLQIQDWALREPVRMAGADLPPARERSHAVLRVLAEPRPLLDVRLAGPPRVDEAVDDQGRSLAVTPPDADFPDRYIADRLPVGLDLRVFLHIHHPPVRQVRRLRGSLPLVVWAEHPERLDVPLAGAEGRTFRGSGVVLQVAPARPGAKPGSLAVDMRPDGDARVAQGRLAVFDAGPDRMFMDLARQFEVTDAAGGRLDLTPGTARANALWAWRVTFAAKPGAPAGVPARLRFRGLAWTRPEVPFDFERLPLP